MAAAAASDVVTPSSGMAARAPRKSRWASHRAGPEAPGPPFRTQPKPERIEFSAESGPVRLWAGSGMAGRVLRPAATSTLADRPAAVPGPPFLTTGPHIRCHRGRHACPTPIRPSRLCGSSGLSWRVGRFGGRFPPARRFDEASEGGRSAEATLTARARRGSGPCSRAGAPRRCSHLLRSWGTARSAARCGGARRSGASPGSAPDRRCRCRRSSARR
jgi:hypothetical protein